MGLLLDGVNGEWLLIVYELVWVIGMGCMLIEVDVVVMYGVICGKLLVILGWEVEVVWIFYGGLVMVDNVVMLLVVGDVDGVLVGGVSLIVVKFVLIIVVVVVI